MTRETYQQSLDDLRDDVLAMGDLVAERLEMALESLSTRDETLARDVIGGDSEINETYLAIEQQCVDLVALQQPVASDLRFITASFKIITDLERIGDLAVNLAEYALAATRELAPDVEIDEIGHNATDLLDRSLEAYETENADACHDIARSDDDIDALCQRASERVTRDLIEREADGDTPWALEQLLDDVSRVLLTIRDIERIADHAVNIAARILYMAENDPSLIY
ncbi:phosphate signaling complex protein PhoU [Halostagnicola kamekurae]|uniref:phosphate signaling complex protein PhoU n=1 Tax=Halostagnicola kamekurae TaxID=619731 RepID=UPI000B8986D3|nr:phosphate signaling complex protein PhoU [Halostagnicola kamekurae]